MSGFLADACAQARRRVAEAETVEPLGHLRARAEAVDVAHDLVAALDTDDVAVIAEVKRASPSRGDLAEIADPAALAAAYADGGAAAVSVLTEPQHFHGSLNDLGAVSGAVDLPVLRKDFIVTPYQVWEARAAGAAACLLIVAALEQEELVELLRIVTEAEMTALLETHEELEVTRAVGAHDAAGAAGRPVVGVNARDLTTLAVDAQRFEALRPHIPDQAIAVAESGVRDAADVARLAGLGADAVLVGEAVATAADPQTVIAGLVAAGQKARL